MIAIIFFIGTSDGRIDFQLSSLRWERLGCYWQTVPSQWGGGRLFDALAKFFFYENGSNFGTESRKMAPKVGNERSLRGLRTDR